MFAPRGGGDAYGGFETEALYDTDDWVADEPSGLEAEFYEFSDEDLDLALDDFVSPEDVYDDWDDP